MFLDQLLTKNNKAAVHPNQSKNSRICTKQAAKSIPQVEFFDEDSFCNSNCSLTIGHTHDGRRSSEPNADDKDNCSTLHKTLSRDESVRVDRLRWFFAQILIVVSAVVSFLVFFIAAYAEEQEFNAQYDGATFKLMTCFDRFIERLGIANSIGIAATAHGLGTSNIYVPMYNSTITNRTSQSQWPFVTIPSFAQRAASARELSKMWLVSIHPIIDSHNRDDWERYVAQDSNKAWIYEGISYLDQAGLGNFEQQPSVDSKHQSVFEIMENITPKPISYFNPETSTFELENGPGPYLAKWQTSPMLKYDDDINTNLLHENIAAKDCIDLGRAVFGRSIMAPPGSVSSENAVTAKMATLRSIANRKEMDHGGALVTTMYTPIFDNFLVPTRKTVGMLLVLFNWREALENVLPIQLRGIYAVVENSCEGSITFMINGPTVDVVGLGDLHRDERYGVTQRLVEFEVETMKIQDGTPDGGIHLHDQGCRYRLHLYPSQEFAKAYITNIPIYATLAVAIAFAFTISMFLLYDRLVEVRQKNILHKAANSTALVSSLFPRNVRDQLLNFSKSDRNLNANSQSNFPLTNSRSKLKAYCESSTSDDHHSTKGTFPLTLRSPTIASSNKQRQQRPKPIADLFQHCTVMFADIAGFTAWSSPRGPEQVFILLQTLFHGFDQAAKRRKVFKVETIGDCYVAVTGLPEPQNNHALIMTRFAIDCKRIMTESMIELQSTLGPDCCDLNMRIGLHSGPVTAGVLVGDRARFQLFGDTVNTAARMESTGLPDKIQVSEITANLIIASNKGHWIERREDLVEAKGKGRMQTYWVNPDVIKLVDTSSSTYRSERKCFGDIASCNESQLTVESSEKMVLTKNIFNVDSMQTSTNHSSLVGWFAKILLDYIEKVMRQNNYSCTSPVTQHLDGRSLEDTPSTERIALDEVKDFIEIFPPEMLQPTTASIESPHNTVFIPEELASNIHEFVSIVASLYRNNSFHSFEHAAQVTMSVQKFLNCLISPDSSLLNMDTIHEDQFGEHHQFEKRSTKLHLNRVSYGLNNDPIAQLAVIFAAMIHDVDHQGCSNVQLMKEDTQMAARYRYKSVAELNSLDVAWSLLMTKQFDRLRNAIFSNQDDLLRFRLILVNSVMATDICDRELNDLYQIRWERAFNSSSSTTSSLSSSSSKLSSLPSPSLLSPKGVLMTPKMYDCDGVTIDEMKQLNQKATMVIELIMRASDVSPTMQHWNIYLKWNRLLFHETYTAFQEGRIDENQRDPSTYWYKGELDFFDRYVIPLAQKMKECQMFGSYSEECLTSAISNRTEWKEKGEIIVNELVQEFDNVL